MSDHDADQPQGENVTLSEGDCLAVLAELPENSFDAIVTDPPYHLASIVKRFGGPNAAAAKEGTDGLFQRSSKGFMGKEWDGGDIAFRPETWAALLRVAKPGAHLVAFNHSRTFHHMATAIEAAGWEIRDSIFDLYDTADAWADFLDTLTADQSKGLHRALAGADGPLMGWLYGTGFPKSHDVAAGIDMLRDDHAEIIKVTAWIAEARDRAGLTNAKIDEVFGTNGMAGHWTTRGAQAAIPKPDQWNRLNSLFAMSVPAEIEDLVDRLNDRKGKPGEAWGQREVVGEETYSRTDNGSWAEHVESGMFKGGERTRKITRATAAASQWEGWGTCLKPAIEPIVLARKPLAAGSVARQTIATGTGGLNIDAARLPDGNRWPANVTHDGSTEVLKRFPFDETGSFGRFFYSSKASKADRAGAKHPTVKPQSLMRWLVRMTTARGGLVLDPFGGSGSTAWAAATEGRRCHLIERDAEYAAHIRSRLPEFDPTRIAEAAAARAKSAAESATDDQPSLFGEITK
ncbi:DNA methyltransferase [Roseobacter weihaiensis]|uniref:DNA methyltransferase n=1 Tax=Roseobacter weihaiensis TaxID=2763262 RepID=UPI001D0A624C|nr:DNA methyltransferase [Roseobacter sp. H9]